MSVQERYEFIAAIKGVGQQQKGQGWMMTLDHKWPNFDYDTILYGNDWTQINGWQVGNSGQFTVQRGSLKRNKQSQPYSGEFPSHYFWDLVDIRDPDYTNPPTQDKPIQKWDIAAAAQDDHRAKQIAWNSAVNNAVHLMAQDYNSAVVTAGRTWSDDFEVDLMTVATRIYSIIVAGPPPDSIGTTPLEAPEMDVEAPPASEPGERPQPNPVEALRQSVRQWNYDHADQVIGTEEILRGLEVLFDIKTKNAADGVALLTPEQLLTMQGLIARGEYFDKIQSPELRF